MHAHVLVVAERAQVGAQHIGKDRRIGDAVIATCALPGAQRRIHLGRHLRKHIIVIALLAQGVDQLAPHGGIQNGHLRAQPRRTG